MFAATIAHVRSLIGQYYDHAANMNSESSKERLKLRYSALVCRHGGGRGGICKYFVTIALVIHPLTEKNRPCALIWVCAFNRKNTVCMYMTYINEDNKIMFILMDVIFQYIRKLNSCRCINVADSKEVMKYNSQLVPSEY